jgi:hypothetical protein
MPGFVRYLPAVNAPKLDVRCMLVQYVANHGIEKEQVHPGARRLWRVRASDSNTELPPHAKLPLACQIGSFDHDNSSC